MTAALLRDKLPEDRLCWICAQDPVSICGLGIDAIKEECHGERTVPIWFIWAVVWRWVFSRKGKNLQINLPIDHERLTDCFVIFGHLLGRSIDPPKSITEEPISGENAAYSQILEVFRKRFDNIVEAPKVIAYRPMNRL